jgi:hypothetical protein
MNLLSGMAPLYELVCGELGVAPDAVKLSAMKSAIASKLEELDANIKDAEENLGETEVRSRIVCVVCTGVWNRAFGEGRAGRGSAIAGASALHAH